MQEVGEYRLLCFFFHIFTHHWRRTTKCADFHDYMLIVWSTKFIQVTFSNSGPAITQINRLSRGSLLGCDAVWTCRWIPSFQRLMLVRNNPCLFYHIKPINTHCGQNAELLNAVAVCAYTVVTTLLCSVNIRSLNVQAVYLAYKLQECP
jgi:hypothetical protein